MVGARRFELLTPCAQGSFQALENLPVFNYLCFRRLRLPCCGLWNRLELGGIGQLHYYLQISTVRLGDHRRRGSPMMNALLSRISVDRKTCSAWERCPFSLLLNLAS